MSGPIHYCFEPRRAIGRTGFQATAIGIGDLADRAAGQEFCVATLRRALDAGLNVVDTAPSYEAGFSERIVGQALAGRRDKVFVIDKIDHLARPAGPQLEASLKRLKMEVVDLVVFHGVSKIEDWRRLAAPRGGLAQLDKCLAAGKARFKGISSHHPDVLQAAIDSGACDVLLFPGGPYGDERYITQILPRAKRAGLGTVTFKAFGAGKLLCDTAGYGKPLPGNGGSALSMNLPHLSVMECVSYSLTCDADVTLLGLSNPDEQDLAFAAVADFVPLSPQRMADIRRRSHKALRSKGPCWWNPPQAPSPDLGTYNTIEDQGAKHAGATGNEM